MHLHKYYEEFGFNHVSNHEGNLHKNGVLICFRFEMAIIKTSICILGITKIILHVHMKLAAEKPTEHICEKQKLRLV